MLAWEDEETDELTVDVEAEVSEAIERGRVGAAKDDVARVISKSAPRIVIMKERLIGRERGLLGKARRSRVRFIAVRGHEGGACFA